LSLSNGPEISFYIPGITIAQLHQQITTKILLSHLWTMPNQGLGILGPFSTGSFPLTLRMMFTLTSILKLCVVYSFFFFKEVQAVQVFLAEE
jgi:hypothetical protein